MNRTPRRVAAWLGLMAWCCTIGPFAQAAKPSIDEAIDSLAAVRTFKQVSISPDGTRVAWVETVREPNGRPSPNSEIQVASVARAGAAPVRISADTNMPHAEHSVTWSPDGTRIAFLSDAAEDGQLELYVANADGGAVRKLTALRGFLDDPRWSPDRKKIAFLFTENAPRAAGPLEPMTPPSGEIAEHIYEQRIATVDLGSGEVRQVSPPDLYVYEYDWSPDSHRFVATAAHGLGDDNWWVAELYTIEAASGETKSILKPSMQMAVPVWSPDGNEIAFIGGLMSDAGANGGDIYVVSATGGAARDVTPGMKASTSWLTWIAPDRIFFTENIDGLSGVASVDPVTDRIATLWTGPEVITAGGWPTNLSLARDGKTSAVVRDSFEHPPEVWAGEIGAWKQVTHVNQGVTPSWGEAKSIHWTSNGLSVQGWLLYPHDYDPEKHYPMVVLVHGGPGASSRASWPGTFYNTSLLSTEGYFVLYPNPRGSFGQGEAFTRANVKDFGYGDLRDILAGVDEVVKTLPVDDHRVGITGWSYGGFMTMWAVTQTHRFRTAVAGAGIANWQSYYGENDIDRWMIPFFGASVYDDPAVYAKSSPINYIRNVKTPTLVIVGDRDGECPAPQSFEFWHALQALGVDTKLVVYPDEGHDIWQPEHRRDIIKRQIQWFNEHMPQ